jgi:aminopeptidase N
LLELMINRTNGITTSDGVSFFNGLANNPVGNRVAFDFLRNRWNDLARE